MTVQIDVWSDFTCPYCFLTAIGLEKLCAEQRLDLHWRTFLLRPSHLPEISTERRDVIEHEREHVGRLVKKNYGLELNPGAIGIDTRLAHIAGKYAAIHQKAADFHFKLMKAYWLNGRPIDQKTELSKLAAEAGLDPTDFLRGLSDFTFSTAVTIDIQLASKYGVQAVPTLIFNGSLVVKGNQTLDALRQNLAKVST